MLFCSICNLLTTKKQEAICQGWEPGDFHLSGILVFCSVVDNKPGVICLLSADAGTLEINTLDTAVEMGTFKFD